MPVWPTSSCPPGLSTSNCTRQRACRRDRARRRRARDRACSSMRIGAPGNFERERRRRRARSADVGRRHLRLQLDAIGPRRCGRAARLRRTTRRASAITSATRPAIGARSTNALPDAAPPPLRSVSSRCASRASRGRQPRLGDGDRAPRLFDAASRHGAFGQQPLGARLVRRARRRAPPAPRRPPPRAWRGRRRRRESRLEPAERLAGATRDRRPTASASARNRPAAGAATIASPPVTARSRRHANRRPQLRLAHRRRRERVGPLLFLQIRDRRRILLRPLLGVGDRPPPRPRTP